MGVRSKIGRGQRLAFLAAALVLVLLGGCGDSGKESEAESVAGVSDSASAAYEAEEDQGPQWDTPPLLVVEWEIAVEGAKDTVYDSFRAMALGPQVYSVENSDAVYTGILLEEVLADLGVEEYSGVTLESADGAVMNVKPAEVAGSQVLLVWAINDQPLHGREAPLSAVNYSGDVVPGVVKLIITAE